ncbi:MAG: glycosyltransferase family 2 protein [Anaerolineae bacterium]|nr:glycosyltransferase family 2 protein [Anaerolineae bacterium]MCO5192599.1 glycosyltransferase family 2 protein [Anaerolineae bacterium]MCO5199177.1 glycosyltransferase family 2 protein [Anaerolineae bacterium]
MITQPRPAKDETMTHNQTAPLVGVVVVNWNRSDDTLRCIASLRQSDYGAVEIVVIDNASTDDSVAVIHSAEPDIALIETGQNLGYTGGHNAGIRYFLERDASYVLLLNNDAVVAPDTITEMVKAAQQWAGLCFVGAEICILEKPDTVLSAGGVLHDGWRVQHDGTGELSAFRPNQPYETEFLSGCAILASRDALARTGLLDEEFFLYYEDVEWSYRARQRGVTLLVAPQALVWHPDTRRRDVSSQRVSYYGTRNALLFARKHGLGLRTRLALWFYHVRMMVSWTVRPRWRHKRPQRDALWLALRDYLGGRFGRSDRY